MQKILGIILLSRQQLYWSTLANLRVEIVVKTMNRNRYLEIKKYMHFVNHLKLTPGNKMSKILPLYDMMNKNLV